MIIDFWILNESCTPGTNSLILIYYVFTYIKIQFADILFRIFALMDKRMIQICDLKEIHFKYFKYTFKYTNYLNVQRCKDIYYAKGMQKRAELDILIQDIIHLKAENAIFLFIRQKCNFIMIRTVFLQNITIININLPNNLNPKFKK